MTSDSCHILRRAHKVRKFKLRRGRNRRRVAKTQEPKPWGKQTKP